MSVYVYLVRVRVDTASRVGCVEGADKANTCVCGVRVRLCVVQCVGVGCAYGSLGQFEKDVEYHSKHRAIALEVGD